MLFFPLRPFLSPPFSLPSQGNFPISFKLKVAIAEFFWKMQRKTLYSILGLDAMPLSLKNLLLKRFAKCYFFFCLFQIDLDDISEAYEEMFSVSLSKVIYETIATGDYRQLLLRILNPERKGKTRKK